MNTVQELLEAKGHDAWTVRQDATVFEALELMAEKNVGAVLVVDEAGTVRGIFSERDYARKIIVKGRTERGTRVRDIMSSPVLYVLPTTTIRECMALMTAKRVRHLPVLDGGALTGIVSIGDVVKAVISEQEALISQQGFLISQLEHYIAGSL
jgi:CBS domain-containing protein